MGNAIRRSRLRNYGVRARSANASPKKGCRSVNRELAKELKAASFPMLPYRAGHKFYPPEHGGVWSDASRRHGVTLIHSDLEDRLQDIKDGYYCSNLSDLIEACGQSFSRLSVVENSLDGGKRGWRTRGNGRQPGGSCGALMAHVEQAEARGNAHGYTTRMMRGALAAVGRA